MLNRWHELGSDGRSSCPETTALFRSVSEVDCLFDLYFNMFLFLYLCLQEGTQSCIPTSQTIHSYKMVKFSQELQLRWLLLLQPESQPLIIILSFTGRIPVLPSLPPRIIFLDYNCNPYFMPLLQVLRKQMNQLNLCPTFQTSLVVSVYTVGLGVEEWDKPMRYVRKSILTSYSTFHQYI